MFATLCRKLGSSRPNWRSVRAGAHVLDVGARERLLAELGDEALPQRLVVDSLLGLFARADVGHRADHAHRAPCVVQDHLAAVEHIEETAVVPPEAVLVAPVLP